MPQSRPSMGVKRHPELTPHIVSPSDITEAKSAARRDRWSRRTVGFVRHIGSEAMDTVDRWRGSGRCSGATRRGIAGLEAHSDDAGSRAACDRFPEPGGASGAESEIIGADLPVPQKIHDGHSSVIAGVGHRCGARFITVAGGNTCYRLRRLGMVRLSGAFVDLPSVGSGSNLSATEYMA